MSKLKNIKIHNHYFVVKEDCWDNVFKVAPTPKTALEYVGGGCFKMAGISNPIHYVYIYDSMEKALDSAIWHNNRRSMLMLKEKFKQESKLRYLMFKKAKEQEGEDGN